MKKKILVILVLVLVLSVCLLAACDKVDDSSKLPEINISSIYNYEIQEDAENIFDISALLPQLPDGADVKYTVKSAGGGTVTVINGTIFLIKGNRYDITVKVTLGTEEKSASFILTTEGYTGETNPDEDNEFAVVSFPLATQFAGKTYFFGDKKITGISGSELRTEVDELKLNYTIKSLNDAEDFDATAIILIDGYEMGSNEADEIATMDEGKNISFKQYGKHTITVMSKVDSTASAALNINVNNGYNIYSEQELRNSFVPQIFTPIPVNMQTDIIFDENDDPFTSAFISIKGEIIYGNGHKIDATKMPRAVYTQKKNDADRNLGVLNFIIADRSSEQVVKINDLIVLGNGKYNDTGYIEGTYNPKDVLNGITIAPIQSGYSFINDANQNLFDYATREEDGLKMQISSKHDAYRHAIYDVQLENVTIMNTLMGLKLQNITNFYSKNLISKNSFMNNVECFQLENAIFENTSLGFSGGAAMELKEDGSRLFKFDMTDKIENAAMYGEQVMYVPANAYDANTEINDFGYMSTGKVLMQNTDPKEMNTFVPEDKPFYVLKRADNKYISNQTITLKGTFSCENWTAGNEVYYMKPGSQDPESSFYIIAALKTLSPNSVKMIDGEEKINYAIAKINWGTKNYTNLNIQVDSFGFYDLPVALREAIPNASWAWNESSILYVNTPIGA